MTDDRVPMQLAVAGELGPVLRSALTTRGVRLATSRTVLRISAPPDVDVLAVMRACDVEGLNVTSVRYVGARRVRRTGAPAPEGDPWNS